MDENDPIDYGDDKIEKKEDDNVGERKIPEIDPTGISSLIAQTSSSDDEVDEDEPVVENVFSRKKYKKKRPKFGQKTLRKKKKKVKKNKPKIEKDNSKKKPEQKWSSDTSDDDNATSSVVVINDRKNPYLKEKEEQLSDSDKSDNNDNNDNEDNKIIHAKVDSDSDVDDFLQKKKKKKISRNIISNESEEVNFSQKKEPIYSYFERLLLYNKKKEKGYTTLDDDEMLSGDSFMDVSLISEFVDMKYFRKYLCDLIIEDGKRIKEYLNGKLEYFNSAKKKIKSKKVKKNFHKVKINEKAILSIIEQEERIKARKDSLDSTEKEFFIKKLLKYYKTKEEYEKMLKSKKVLRPKHERILKQILLDIRTNNINNLVHSISKPLTNTKNDINSDISTNITMNDYNTISEYNKGNFIYSLFKLMGVYFGPFRTYYLSFLYIIIYVLIVMFNIIMPQFLNNVYDKNEPMKEVNWNYLYVIGVSICVMYFVIIAFDFCMLVIDLVILMVGKWYFANSPSKITEFKTREREVFLRGWVVFAFEQLFLPISSLVFITLLKVNLFFQYNIDISYNWRYLFIITYCTIAVSIMFYTILMLILKRKRYYVTKYNTFYNNKLFITIFLIVIFINIFLALLSFRFDNVFFFHTIDLFIIFIPFYVVIIGLLLLLSYYIFQTCVLSKWGNFSEKWMDHALKINLYMSIIIILIFSIILPLNLNKYNVGGVIGVLFVSFNIVWIPIWILEVIWLVYFILYLCKNTILKYIFIFVYKNYYDLLLFCKFDYLAENAETGRKLFVSFPINWFSHRVRLVICFLLYFILFPIFILLLSISEGLYLQFLYDNSLFWLLPISLFTLFIVLFIPLFAFDTFNYIVSIISQSIKSIKISLKKDHISRTNLMLRNLFYFIQFEFLWIIYIVLFCWVEFSVIVRTKVSIPMFWTLFAAIPSSILLIFSGILFLIANSSSFPLFTICLNILNVYFLSQSVLIFLFLDKVIISLYFIFIPSYLILTLFILSSASVLFIVCSFPKKWRAILESITFCLLSILCLVALVYLTIYGTSFWSYTYVPTYAITFSIFGFYFLFGSYFCGRFLYMLFKADLKFKSYKRLLGKSYVKKIKKYLSNNNEKMKLLLENDKDNSNVSSGGVERGERKKRLYDNESDSSDDIEESIPLRSVPEEVDKKMEIDIDSEEEKREFKNPITPKPESEVEEPKKEELFKKKKKKKKKKDKKKKPKKPVFV